MHNIPGSMIPVESRESVLSNRRNSFWSRWFFKKHFLKHPFSGTRNSRWLIGNVRHSRAASCLWIVAFLLLARRIHLVLQSPDLRQELIHRAWQVHWLAWCNSDCCDSSWLLISMHRRPIRMSFIWNHPVPPHFSLRLFLGAMHSPWRAFGFSSRVIMEMLFLRQESFLFLGRHAAKFTISLSVQQGFFNIWTIACCSSRNSFQHEHNVAVSRNPFHAWHEREHNVAVSRNSFHAWHDHEHNVAVSRNSSHAYPPFPPPECPPSKNNSRPNGHSG